MPESDSLLVDYVKKKLKLNLEESSFLNFLNQHQHFFGSKKEIWKEKASIYLYSIVFSICNDKKPDLFFELIERQLQRSELDELKTIFNSLKLSTEKLEKKWLKKKIKDDFSNLEASFQISILVKVLENKLEILSINFLDSIIEHKLKDEFLQAILADKHINANQDYANQALEYMEKKFS